MRGGENEDRKKRYPGRGRGRMADGLYESMTFAISGFLMFIFVKRGIFAFELEMILRLRCLILAYPGMQFVLRSSSLFVDINHSRT